MLEAHLVGYVQLPVRLLWVNTDDAAGGDSVLVVVGLDLQTGNMSHLDSELVHKLVLTLEKVLLSRISALMVCS